MEKYLFLYLKTGGGHLAPAKAVAGKIMAKKKWNAEIILFDGLTNARKIVRKIIEDGYRNAVNNAVWSYEILYAFHKINVFSRLTTNIISIFIKPGIENQILKLHPDKIVIFHFFLIKPVYAILEEFKLNIPVITVVTDPFTAHPIWFLRKDQNYILFSEMLKEKCLKRGIDIERIKVFPFVLDRKFSQKTSSIKSLSIRKELGFREDSKIILIMGGGDGMPRGKKILKHLIAGNVDAEIAIVCGNNKKLYQHVLKLQEKYNTTNLKIYGYVDYVHTLIDISDVVITKCGASTFMEILLKGKIPVINDYIWEQEKGNMEFVCDGNMGILEKDTSRIPDVLNKLLTDSNYSNSFRTNIKRASLSNGVGPVSEYIISFNS